MTPNTKEKKRRGKKIRHHHLEIEQHHPPHDLHPEPPYVGQTTNGKPEHLDEVPLDNWSLGQRNHTYF